MCVGGMVGVGAFGGVKNADRTFEQIVWSDFG